MPSTGFPKPSVILIHSRKKLRRIKGKRKKETSDEESSKDEIQVAMGIERVPQGKEKQHLASNPLVLLPITGRAYICSGCRVQFTGREQKQPQDLVFRIQMKRQYPKDGQIKTSLKKSNVLFHMKDLGCIRQIKELAYVEHDHIYMTNADFLELTLIFSRSATTGIT